MSFTNFTTGKSHGFDGEFRKIIPSEKIVYTDVFNDPDMKGETLTTVI